MKNSGERAHFSSSEGREGREGREEREGREGREGRHGRGRRRRAEKKTKKERELSFLRVRPRWRLKERRALVVEERKRQRKWARVVSPRLVGKTLLKLPCNHQGDRLNDGRGRYANLCGTCSATRKLPRDYFPTFLNEVICYGKLWVQWKAVVGCLERLYEAKNTMHSYNFYCRIWTVGI